MMKKGDQVSIDGKSYTLGEFLGQGAEGEVFRLAESKTDIVKILRLSKSESVNIQKRKALQRLARIENVSKHTRLMLPKELLDPPNIGYKMRYYPESMKLSALLEEPADLNAFKKMLKSRDENFMKRLKIAALLFKSLHFIHQEGLTFCDVSPGNVLVKKDQIGIAFIDTDNLVVNNLFSPNVSGTLRYMAPEVVNSIKEASRYSDVYSMAILVFELLTFRHPFIGDDILKSNVEEEHKAFQGKHDYVLKENTTNAIRANQFKHLVDVYFTPKLRELFLTTFTKGKDTHFDRPTAEEFAFALYQAIDKLDYCEYDTCGFPYDKTRFTACPLCKTISGEHDVFRVVLEVHDDEKLVVSNVISEQVIKPDVENDIYERHIKEESIGQSQLVGRIKYSRGTGRGRYAFAKNVPLHKRKIVDESSGKVHELTKDAYEYNMFKTKIIFDETIAEFNGKMRTIRISGRALKTMRTTVRNFKLKDRDAVLRLWTTKGLKHTNQDSFAYRIDDNGLVLGMADGLGSKRFSRTGAEKATMLFRDLPITSMTPDTLLQVQRKWTEAFANLDVTDYDSTLMGLMVSSKIFMSKIGDGLMVLCSQSKYEEYTKTYDYLNETESLTSITEANKGQFWTESLPNESFIILMMTDGIANVFDEPIVRKFAERIYRAHENDRSDDLTRSLKEWIEGLNDKGYADDKTLGLLYVKGENNA